MATYAVFLTTTASLTVEVEIPDGLDADEAREVAIEKAYETMPSGRLCHQCSGYRQKWEMDLGQFEPDEDTEPEPIGH